MDGWGTERWSEGVRKRNVCMREQEINGERDECRCKMNAGESGEESKS